jgi:hypothetical protein
MKKHIKVYTEFFRIDNPDEGIDELFGFSGNNIHHIYARGMGGSKLRDGIDNLMCLRQDVHEIVGDKSAFRELLIDAHRLYMEEELCYLHAYPGDSRWELFKDYDDLYSLIQKERRYANIS